MIRFMLDTKIATGSIRQVNCHHLFATGLQTGRASALPVFFIIDRTRSREGRGFADWFLGVVFGETTVRQPVIEWRSAACCTLSVVSLFDRQNTFANGPDLRANKCPDVGIL